MYEAVRDKAVLLMEFDQYLLDEQEKTASQGVPKKRPTEMPAVQLLIENTQAIPVRSCTVFHFSNLFSLLSSSFNLWIVP